MYLDGRITDPRMEEFSDGFDKPPANERKIKLRERLLEAGQRIAYTYDFGDSWEHEILLEKLLPREAGMDYPACIAGKRACPPDDCGGTGGYIRLLAILADPKHEEHDDMLEWLGIDRADEFEPEEFDVVTANEMLKDGYRAVAA